MFVYKKFSLYLYRINLHLKTFHHENSTKTVQKQFKNSSKTVQKQFKNSTKTVQNFSLLKQFFKLTMIAFILFYSSCTDHSPKIEMDDYNQNTEMRSSGQLESEFCMLSGASCINLSFLNQSKTYVINGCSIVKNTFYEVLNPDWYLKQSYLTLQTGSDLTP